MKTLKLILQGYVNGEYGMLEMADIVDETMKYAGYKIENGKRYLQAFYKGKFIEVSSSSLLKD